MIQASKIVGTGLATTGQLLIGAGVGIGVFFLAYILGFYYTDTTGIFSFCSWLHPFSDLLLLVSHFVGTGCSAAAFPAAVIPILISRRSKY